MRKKIPECIHLAFPSLILSSNSLAHFSFKTPQLVCKPALKSHIWIMMPITEITAIWFLLFYPLQVLAAPDMFISYSMSLA